MGRLGLGQHQQKGISQLADLRGDTWVATFEHKRGLKLFSNGTISPSHPYPSWGWWTTTCSKGFQDVSQDPRMGTFWQLDSIVGNKGQSDMLYVSLHHRHQAEAFRALLEIFGAHKVFLECALPAALNIMQSHFNTTSLVHGPALYFVGKDRKCPNDWNCFHSNASEAFHPIKLGVSAPFWKQSFQRLTLGNDMGNSISSCSETTLHRPPLALVGGKKKKKRRDKKRKKGGPTQMGRNERGRRP